MKPVVIITDFNELTVCSYFNCFYCFCVFLCIYYIQTYLEAISIDSDCNLSFVQTWALANLGLLPNHELLPNQGLCPANCFCPF